jgi:kumamolisin
MAKHLLDGSERAPLPDSRVLGPADPQEQLEVTVLVQRNARQALRDRVSKLTRGDRSLGHLSREEFEQQHGASAADLTAVKQFAKSHGLVLVKEHPGRRMIVLGGTVAQFNDAFGVQLQNCEHAGKTYRCRQGSVQLPDQLRGVVEAVLGLDNRPQARPHFRVRPNDDGHAQAASRHPSTFTPMKLASLYDFPESDGAGECVAIVELGGGFNPDDLNAYFKGLNIATPRVQAVSVGQGSNQPTGDPNGPDGEVMLDIEIVGALVPKATIAVYFAPNTDAGFLHAVAAAIHDNVRKPSVISISWGGAEASWTQQAMTAMDEAFQAAAAMGITVCVASGDDGSSDGVGDGADHVDFPASSPYVLACGGTSLHATATAITNEVVWNDKGGGAGGGGVSSFFPLPAWQQGLEVTDSAGDQTALTHRGVPDVCGDADPQTGYQVRVDGTNIVVGGTSAVAPLWAGLVARINAIGGQPLGYINPGLYQQPNALRDITVGNNGDFAASPGWDACTGLGSPDGRQVANIPGL